MVTNPSSKNNGQNAVARFYNGEAAVARNRRIGAIIAFVIALLGTGYASFVPNHDGVWITDIVVTVVCVVISLRLISGGHNG